MVLVPRKVGFFHFGSDNRKMPDQLLEKAMEEAGGWPCLRESLIVLPEAFNIGVNYAKGCDPGSKPDFSPGIKGRLGEIAGRFECAFVAGLIVDGAERVPLSGAPSAVRPPSAAYFISASSCKRLSLKKGDDKTGFYVPSDEVVDSPFAFDQGTVSALICMDAVVGGVDPALAERQEKMRATVERLGGSCHIFCAPVNTDQYGTLGIAEAWGRAGFHVVVVANGRCGLHGVGPLQPGYFPSVIWIKGGDPLPFLARTNIVIVRPLDA